MKIEFISQRRETLLLNLAVRVVSCRIAEKIQCFKEEGKQQKHRFVVLLMIYITNNSLQCRRILGERKLVYVRIVVAAIFDFMTERLGREELLFFVPPFFSSFRPFRLALSPPPPPPICPLDLRGCADQRFGTIVKCLTGRASFWVKFRLIIGVRTC